MKTNKKNTLMDVDFGRTAGAGDGHGKIDAAKYAQLVRLSR